MEETRIRNAIIVELLMPKPMGQDMTQLKDVLDQRSGIQIHDPELRDVLEKMAKEGLLQKEEKIVGGSRVIPFYTATGKGKVSLRVAIAQMTAVSEEVACL